MCQTLSIKSSSNDLDCINLYRARMFYHYVLCGYSCLQALESSLQNQTFLLYLYDIICHNMRIYYFFRYVFSPNFIRLTCFQIILSGFFLDFAVKIWLRA